MSMHLLSIFGLDILIFCAIAVAAGYVQEKYLENYWFSREE